MAVADFEFESCRINWFPLYCCRFQRTILSAFRFSLCGFLRTSITLKRLLSKLDAQSLKAGQAVRKVYVQFFECSTDMQAIARRQTAQQSDRADQKGVTLTLRQVRISQRWVAQLPSLWESGA